mgnify:FL=1
MNKISLLKDDNIITEEQDIANIFNKYFTSIAEKLVAKIPHTNKHFHDFLKNPNENSLFLIPIENWETEAIISHLDSSKSTGPNSIPTKILKTLKEQIATPLTILFNLSFQTGIFPDSLKIAKVIPILSTV